MGLGSQTWCIWGEDAWSWWAAKPSPAFFLVPQASLAFPLVVELPCLYAPSFSQLRHWEHSSWAEAASLCMLTCAPLLHAVAMVVSIAAHMPPRDWKFCSFGGGTCDHLGWNFWSSRGKTSICPKAGLGDTCARPKGHARKQQESTWRGRPGSRMRLPSCMHPQTHMRPPQGTGRT
jgi:hypothetical protein